MPLNLLQILQDLFIGSYKLPSIRISRILEVFDEDMDMDFLAGSRDSPSGTNIVMQGIQKVLHQSLPILYALLVIQTTWSLSSVIL